MIHKLVMIIVLAMMPVTATAIIGEPIGGSKVQTVDATNYTATCAGIQGSLTFSPPIHDFSSGGTTSVTMRANLSGCHSSPALASGFTGKLTGSFSLGPGGIPPCAGVGVPMPTLSGSSLSIHWGRTRAILSSGDSVIGIFDLSSGVGPSTTIAIYLPSPGGTPSSATGSFQGTDAGADDQLATGTRLGHAALEGKCASRKGLAKVVFSGGVPSSPMLSLG